MYFKLINSCVCMNVKSRSLIYDYRKLEGRIDFFNVRNKVVWNFFSP